MTEPNPVREAVSKLEKELALPSGFLDGLLAGDDWSFVIKAHAVLEAAVTYLLTTAVNDERLRPFFARLELAGATIGKLVVVKALGLDFIEDTDRRFIRSLSELRNDLVHDIRQASFTFADHVDRMDEKTLKQFRKNFDSWSLGGETEVMFDGPVKVTEFFREKPKLALWYSTMSTLALIYRQKEVTQDVRRRRDEKMKAAGVIEFAERIGVVAKTLNLEPLNPEVPSLDLPAPPDAPTEK
jgi:hypothetical protein